MHHNFIRHSDNHWGCSLLSPHRIRPPDGFYIGAHPRYGVWLSFICLLVFICPRVGSQFRSAINEFHLGVAENFLSLNSEFPRNLESFELGFVSRSERPVSVHYNVTPSNVSWIFITPCSKSGYTMSVQSFASEYDSSKLNTTSIPGEQEFDNWYEKVRVIDMKYNSGIGEKINITNWKRQQINVTNIIFGVMRLHIEISDSLPAVYMIRQYSGKIDAFYPRIPPDSSVRVCITNDINHTLKIHATRAFNADKYCVILNTEYTLPNFCSVQLRIDKNWLNQIKDYTELNIRRPVIFDNFYEFQNIPKLGKFIFRCFTSNSFEVRLDKTYRKSIIFINIFAINSMTQFSDSYRPIKYRWGQFQNVCNKKKKQITIDKFKPHLWIMGNETVLFNISIERNGIYSNKLLYQSCRHSQEQSLHVFQQESQTPLCVEIGHTRLTALCTSLKPGMYRLEHTLNSKSRSPVPVGQLYFLPDNTDPFPHLHCNKTSDYSINLHKAALDDSKTHYKLNITFSRIPSLSNITYYFHIINFRIPNDSRFNQIEFMSQIEAKIKKERNFCKSIDNEFGVDRIIHNVTLSGLGCSDSIQKEEYAAIPGLFNGNNTYAVLVYFSRSNDWRLDYVQFYSNRIFTMSTEEDVF